MEKLDWFIDVHRNTGMNCTKLRILCEMGVKNGSRVTPKKLSEATGIHPQTVYSVLRELREDGYVDACRLTCRGRRVLGIG